MTFCSDCGDKLIEGKKFCSGCGTKVEQIRPEITLDVESTTSNQESIFNDDEDLAFEKPARELGTDLEDMVEQIMKIKGYETLTRQKMRGNSGQYNEIDILAKQDDNVIAVECKNYKENKKIGISELRNFSAKLSDLEISKGLFVTTTDFSQDAIGWASNNPQMTQIDLWNGDQLEEIFKKTILRRTGSKTIKIYDCLDIQDTIENYSNLLLKNKNKIQIIKQELIFYPIYVTEFTFKEQFRTPDKQIHSPFNSGQYFVDGISKKILSSFDDNGPSISKDAEKNQIVSDIRNNAAYKFIEVQKISGNEIITQLRPTMSNQDIEFVVKKDIIQENKTRIDYFERVSREEVVHKEFQFIPNSNAIQVQSKVIFVPKLEIEFDSFGTIYRRSILPASDITLLDEIAFCNNRKHLLGKKVTFAVCEVCGVAKCEDHIFTDDEDLCFCKDHASAELKESQKGPSIKEKLGRFSFKKKSQE